MKLRALLAVLFITSAARAEEPLPTPAIVTFPPGEDTITAVKKGETAPYAGQLFDENTSLRWAMWLQQYKLRYGADLKAAQDSCKVEVAREGVYRAIESERNRKSEADLVQRLKDTEKARFEADEKLRNPPFWREPMFWYVSGILTATAVFVAVEAAR